MRLLISMIAMLVLCTRLNGNDTFATLGTGGLVPAKTTEVAMESEDLDISAHEITVRYKFRNKTDRDIVTTIAFPLPPLNGGDLYNSPIALPDKADTNFVDFRVWSDGVPVRTKSEIRAFDRKRDITGRVRNAGLSGNVLLKPLNAAVSKLSPTTRRTLEKEGLIMPDDFNPPLRGIGKKGWWATWTMRVQYYWEQKFPANSSVELIQKYRPVVGGSYIVQNDSGEGSVKRYCGTSNTIRTIADMKKRHLSNEESAISLWERRIDYVLTTANNWSGPIRQFHLSVSLDAPEDIFVTCFPGFRKANATRSEVSRVDFRPDSELHILILQSKQPAR